MKNQEKKNHKKTSQIDDESERRRHKSEQLQDRKYDR